MESFKTSLDRCFHATEEKKFHYRMWVYKFLEFVDADGIGGLSSC